MSDVEEEEAVCGGHCVVVAEKRSEDLYSA